MGDNETCKRVQSFLKTKFQVSSVPFPWIEGCVTWFRNIHANTTNIQELFDFVAQQWLLADFQHLKIKSLPPNLKNTSVLKLDENYLLQISHIINIGLSAYSQHCRISKGPEGNSEVTAEEKIYSKWEPKGKRMLLLHLTDGTQNVQAMEYVPLPQLNLDVHPGSKILIKGPVECRRGVFLLRPSNMVLLGGEVEELVKTNAPENILARMLGAAENPNPVYGNYAKATVDPDEGDEWTSQVNISSSCSSSKRTWSAALPAGRDGGEKRALNDNQLPPAKKLQSDRTHPATHPPRHPAKHPATIEKQRASDASATEIFPDDDDDILLLAADIVMDDTPPLAGSIPRHATRNNSAIDAAVSNSGASLLKNLQHPPAVPAAVADPADPARPFTYLASHLRRRGLSDPATTVCVKGFISTIRTKLEAREGRWRLGAKINDGSAGIDVNFAHKVLEILIGYSPMGLKTLMSSAGDNRRLAVEALENAKQRLIGLNCIMYVRWEPYQPCPTVIRVEEICRQHLEMANVIQSGRHS